MLPDSTSKSLFFGVSYLSNAVAVIDANLGKVRALIPAGTGPVFAAPLSRQRLLIVDTNNLQDPSSSPSSIAILDLDTHQLLHQTSLGVTAFAKPLVAPDQATAYLASPQKGLVLVVNLRTWKVERTVTISGQPNFMALDAKRHILYVTTTGGDSLDEINTVTDLVTSVIHVGGAPAPLALSTNGRLAFMDTASGSLVGLSLKTHMIIWRISLPGGAASRIAVDPATQLLYAATPRTKTIEVVSLKDHRVVRQIKTSLRGDVVSMILQ